MGELAIRGGIDFAVPQYQSVGKTEKQSGSAEIRKTAGAPGYTVSDTLRQLTSRAGQAESQIREGRRTLRTGETVLDEVQDNLARIKELAQQAEQGAPNRSALQTELDQLRDNINRMLRGAMAGDTPLFLDEDGALEESVEALLDAVMDEASGKQEVTLPDWLMKGLALDAPSANQLLAELGLDQSASGAELLAAVAGRPLESDPAAAYLATLYLGAVIAGADLSQEIDPREALAGLEQLLEKVAEGVPLDQAIEELTNGEFTSLADFQAQFTSGTAPKLQDFLVNLLLTNGESTPTTGSPLLALLAGIEGTKFDLIMGLLSMLPSSEAGSQTASETALASDSQAAQTPDAPEAAGPQAPASAAAPPPTSVLQFGTMQVLGRDLSGVSYNETTGQLTVSGTEDVVIQGTEQGKQAILITGSGTVTLQNISGSIVTVDSTMARMYSAGQNALAELSLREGASLTFSGGGLLKIGLLHANESNTLRLAGGAVAVEEPEDEAARVISASILLERAVSLAAHANSVSNFSGKQLETFDLVWKALLPGWSSITSMTVDGKQAKMNLLGGDRPDPVRLWLDKGDPTHGFSIHSLILRGRDKVGRLQTRYAYLRWNQNTGRFQTLSMYPNPFTVTGGEAGQDWTYEEETHTLNILTSQVTAISGGRGLDADQTPFTGRIALADCIGTLELALGGVVCRASFGSAFSLGQQNDVTLILKEGTHNRFEGGAGCAGISLGESTCLNIDCAKPRDDRTPIGALTAAGNAGGAGIGRDSGASRNPDDHIMIRGGVITAVGAGGGAGIGAGKHSSMGPIIITGGTVSAEAGYHAAAIGAGVHGVCGDILISGTARIVKAVGGDPGADIGACLFGNCGEVQISGGADIGTAQLRRKAGISLHMGEESITLPQFRLSSRTLRLDDLNITTREDARSAKLTVAADQRWVAQVQEAYSALYGRLEESFSGLYSFHQYISVPEEPVRNSAAANTLLQDMILQSSQAVRTHSKRGTEDVRTLLR